MRKKLMICIILAIWALAAALPGGSAAQGLPPRGNSYYCCAAYLEIRPPTYWNRRIINRRLPATCRRVCGRPVTRSAR